MANYRSKMRLALVQHDYTPYWQPRDVLLRVTAERYRPFYEWASKYDGFAGTVNINSSLMELLARHGQGDVVDAMRTAVERGSIELLDTVAYHCIVPLSTPSEIALQIEHDRAVKRGFGFPEQPRRGIYLSEYAYDRDSAAVLRDLGYEYTIADDELFVKMHGGPTPFDRVITDPNGLRIFLRSRDWGNRLRDCRSSGMDFDRFRREFPASCEGWFGGRRGYAVIATDGETFGHHQKDMIDWLVVPLLENWDKRRDAEVVVVSLSELIEEFGDTVDQRFVPPSTWSTSHQDLTEGRPYPLWNDQNNVWHRSFWQMAELMRQAPDLPELAVDRLKAMTSCGPWWVSKHATEFCPRLFMENIDMMLSVIERSGQAELIAHARDAYQGILALPGYNR